jgi:hypothetical protein
VDARVSIGASIPDFRPTHRDGANPGQDLPLRAVTVANKTLAPIFRFQMAMFGKKGRNFGLHRLCQKPPGSGAQDFRQWVVRFPWLP